MANHVTPTQKVDVIKEDPPDNRILECADYIVKWEGSAAIGAVRKGPNLATAGFPVIAGAGTRKVKLRKSDSPR